MTIKRQVFFSFHYEPDVWRTSQVRNIGVIEGNDLVSDNHWETIKGGGENAIKRWIDDQLRLRSCTVVLVGSNTANRKWINYEICKSLNAGKGVVGVYIHGLKDSNGATSTKGRNPFDCIFHDKTGVRLSNMIKCYDPGGNNSTDKYNWISTHLSPAIEEAIGIRKQW